MANLKGWKTLGFNLLLVVGPPALAYLASVNWADYISPTWAPVVVGLVGIVLRAVTTTPIGSSEVAKRGGPNIPNMAVIAFLIGAAALFVSDARAADMRPPLPGKAAEPVTPLCTPQACTVFYAGAFMGGLGDNLNILGNGVNGSLNSGGMLPGGDIGAQYYDGKFLFAVEADAGYQLNSNTTVNGVGGDQSGFFGIVQVKAGVGAGLLPTQQPLVLNLPLPIVTPYVAGGNMFQGHGGSGPVGGAGIIFQLPASNSLFLDAEYLNGGGTNTAGATKASNNNIFFVKLHKAFNF